MLIVEDYRATSDQVKAEVIAAGFEFIAESKAIDGEDEPHAPKLTKTPKNHKALGTDRFLLKVRKPKEN